ncbi:hypothetical protein ACEPPN_017667 [Leptodophora sp. 'Broadleaf-Isolate-01']
MGYPVVEIPYYKNKRFNFVGYLEALESAGPGSVVILHACAQNPTGCDPTKEQWKEIGATIKSRNLFSIFNAAYLGFNSEDVDKDAWANRYFASELHLKIGLGCSFAKNIGLSGMQFGNKTECGLGSRTRSAVFDLNTPAYGAKLVSTVLGTPELKSQWDKDIATMSENFLCQTEAIWEAYQASNSG